MNHPSAFSRKWVESFQQEVLEGLKELKPMLEEVQDGIRQMGNFSGRLFCIATGKALSTFLDLTREVNLEWTEVVGVGTEDIDLKDIGVRETIYLGSHPHPTKASISACELLSSKISSWNLTQEDLVVYLLSGGTSALFGAPAGALTHTEYKFICERLFYSGLDVTQINAVRRVISRLHGGRLLVSLQPSAVITFAMVDNLQTGARDVGSGPTVPLTNADFRKAEAILKQIAIPKAIINKVNDIIKHEEFREFVSLSNHAFRILLSPKSLLNIAQNAAKKREFVVKVFPDPQTEDINIVHSTFRKILNWANTNCSVPVCFMANGEAVLTITEQRGKGGRCQHLALLMIEDVERVSMNACFVAMSTDGVDYLPGIQGAWVDENSNLILKKIGFDTNEALSSFDSHVVLDAIDHLLLGPSTGINLCDLYALFLWPNEFPKGQFKC